MIGKVLVALLTGLVVAGLAVVCGFWVWTGWEVWRVL